MKFHTVYITRLGVPFIEEEQEFPDAANALLAAADEFAPTKDDKGNLHFSPVAVKTVDGKWVVIPDYDHILVWTTEELKQIQEQERAAMARYSD